MIKEIKPRFSKASAKLLTKGLRQRLYCSAVFVLVALASEIFASCATGVVPRDIDVTSNVSSGVLTITDIPAEFNGKYLSIPMYAFLINASASEIAAYGGGYYFHPGNNEVVLPVNAYKDKLVSFPVYTVIDTLCTLHPQPPDESPRVIFARVGIAIRDGEVTLPLYIWEKTIWVLGDIFFERTPSYWGDQMHDYTDTDTREVQLNIRDRADISFGDINAMRELTRVDGILKSVKFVNGVAMVEWDDVVR
jgi:hypothetical protein